MKNAYHAEGAWWSYVVISLFKILMQALSIFRERGVSAFFSSI
jgi:hypothetical protein